MPGFFWAPYMVNRNVVTLSACATQQSERIKSSWEKVEEIITWCWSLLIPLNSVNILLWCDSYQFFLHFSTLALLLHPPPWQLMTLQSIWLRGFTKSANLPYTTQPLYLQVLLPSNPTICSLVPSLLQRPRPCGETSSSLLPPLKGLHNLKSCTNCQDSKGYFHHEVDHARYTSATTIYHRNVYWDASLLKIS